MNRQEKEAVIQQLKDNFSSSSASFVVGYKGLTVAQMQALRRELHNQGGTFKVTKARLMKRAVSDIDNIQDLTPFLKEQIGLVFVSDEVPGVAKTLHEFAKENKALSLIAGCMDSSLLDAQGIERIASLPSREVLLAMLVGTIQAPSRNFVGVLNMMVLRLLIVLKKIEEQKQQ